MAVDFVPTGANVISPAGFLTSFDGVFIQDSAAPMANTTPYPWGLTGTPTYPVYNLGCLSGVTFTPTIEDMVIECDNGGEVYRTRRVKGYTISGTLKSVLPLSFLSNILGLGTPTDDTTQSIEFAPVGVYVPRTFHVLIAGKYDNGSVGFYFYKCTISGSNFKMPAGTNSAEVSLDITAFADTALPSTHSFGAVLRSY